MNREIIFKAKRKDSGEWVEGYYCKTTIGNDVRPSDVIFVQFKVSRNEEWGWMKVDPDTLCQYTGLTDKNDQKIWENDILRRDGYWDIRIEFENGTFMVRNADKVQYINHVTCTPIGTFNIKGYEVIGNIFDNADLLEVD